MARPLGYNHVVNGTPAPLRSVGAHYHRRYAYEEGCSVWE
jgi:hypothetical protein